MNNTSIDGLRRRSGAKKSQSSATKKTAKKVVVKRTPKTTRKSLEVPDNRKSLKALIDENSALEAEATKVEKKEHQERAAKEFLEEVRDINPTDLADVPKKERKKSKMKKKDRKPKKKHKVLKRVLLILLLLILGGGAFVYFYLNDFVAKITDNGSLLGLIFSDPDTPLQKDDMGRTNIIVIGTEGYSMDDPQYDGGFLTDTMMLLSINQDTGDAKAISLPRDLKAKTCTSTSKLNEVYYCEYSKNKSKDESAIREAEKKAVAKVGEAFTEVLGVDIHYHVHANWAAVVKIVDAIGGVDIVFTTKGQTWEGDETVIETTDKRGLRDINSHRQTYLDLPNGQPLHLDGATALAVARVRNAYGGYGAANGNFSREYFQQRILEAIVKQARKKNITSDLMAVLQIKEAIGDNLRTDFKDSEIKTALKVISSVDLANLQTVSLFSTDDKPAALMTTGTINGISYVLPTAGLGKYDAIKSYIKRKFSAEAFTAENAQIVVMNGTSANGIANKEKTELENRGYIVKNTANAPSDQSNFDGVRVYQKNSNLNLTAEALKKLYNVEVSTEIPESLKNTEADFIVIVGAGFSHSK